MRQPERSAGKAPHKMRRQWTAKEKLFWLTKLKDEYGGKIKTLCKAKPTAPQAKSIRGWRGQQAQLLKAPSYVKRFNPARARFPAIEQQLLQWFLEVRMTGAPVAVWMLGAEAVSRVRKDLSIPEKMRLAFKGSDKYVSRFMRRFHLSLRAGTTTTITTSPETARAITAFHRRIIELRTEHNYRMSDIANMDQVAGAN